MFITQHDIPLKLTAETSSCFLQASGDVLDLRELVRG